jgi:methyl-accepting chemotaxis protein
MDQLTNTRTVLIYVMVGLFGAFLLASYMLTYRRILKSLARLQAGTAVIGSGNLNFVMKEKTNDEIGDLSHAFNQMTTNLKVVTASKQDLEGKSLSASSGRGTASTARVARRNAQQYRRCSHREQRRRTDHLSQSCCRDADRLAT